MKTFISITEGTRKKEKQGNRPCNSRGCKTCRHIKTTDTFRSTDTKRSRKSYKVHTAANCKTKGTIYRIQCRKCPKQYLGSTKNALHIRLNGHRYDIKHKKIQKPVAKHFNQRGHSIEDLTIMVIEKLRNNNIQFRRRQERFWTDKLGCMAPEELNLIWCAHTSLLHTYLVCILCTLSVAQPEQNSTVIHVPCLNLKYVL